MTGKLVGTRLNLWRAFAIPIVRARQAVHFVERVLSGTTLLANGYGAGEVSSFTNAIVDHFCFLTECGSRASIPAWIKQSGSACHSNRLTVSSVRLEKKIRFLNSRSCWNTCLMLASLPSNSPGFMA